MTKKIVRDVRSGEVIGGRQVRQIGHQYGEPVFEKAQGTNMFGGLNPHGLYVPMSEDEQEVVRRLVEADDLEVVAHGWGTLHQPQVIVGDHRVGIKFTIDFKGSSVARPLTHLDLELRTRSGLSLFRETKHIAERPMVSEGTFLEFQWDIAVHSMDPNVVKLVKPGAKGLTSRRQDRDSKDMTAQGNMRLNDIQKRFLRHLEKGQAQVRRTDKVKAAKAAKDG